MFGAAMLQPQAAGTRAVPYQKTIEKDGASSTGTPVNANFLSISAMPQYQSKSVEELRCVEWGV